MRYRLKKIFHRILTVSEIIQYLIENQAIFLIKKGPKNLSAHYGTLAEEYPWINKVEAWLDQNQKFS